MGRVVGIDLGTTNSCIAVGDDSSECRVLSNNHGARTTPSVVAITEQDDRLVGRQMPGRKVVSPGTGVLLDVQEAQVERRQGIIPRPDEVGGSLGGALPDPRGNQRR